MCWQPVLPDLTKECLQYPNLDAFQLAVLLLATCAVGFIVFMCAYHERMFLTWPYFRSILWVGPALLFSTASSVSVLGWDGKARTILSISMPYAGAEFCIFSMF